MNSPAHESLRSLLDLPGTQNVLLIDHTGDCLAHLGCSQLSPAKLTVWSVLARASFSAGDELGQRADAGSCQEITNLHERGGSILRLVSGGQLLVLHFDSTPALGTLRLAVREAAEKLSSLLVPRQKAESRCDPAALDHPGAVPGGTVLFEAYEAEDGAIHDSHAFEHAMMCHED